MLLLRTAPPELKPPKKIARPPTLRVPPSLMRNLRLLWYGLLFLLPWAMLIVTLTGLGTGFVLLYHWDVSLCHLWGAPFSGRQVESAGDLAAGLLVGQVLGLILGTVATIARVAENWRPRVIERANLRRLIDELDREGVLARMSAWEHYQDKTDDK